MHLPPRPLRNDDARLLLESFLVAAVVSVLGIRWFLTIADFPKLGIGQLHIAHMLWGGALMLAALLLLIVYLDRPVQHVAAVIAGLGFGTFIDEIGKFVTSDTDYFFRPAIALIYVVFVVLFLVGRTLAGESRLTEREALANAIDLLEVRLESPLEADDRARIEGLLDRAGTQPILVPAIRSYIRGLPERPDHEAWWELIPRWFAGHYRRMAADPRFSYVLTAAVILYTVAVVIGSLLALIAARRTDSPMTVATLAQVLSTLAGAALVARGVVALPGSQAAAYRWFIRGILVWLLLTQVFAFYSSQLLALGGLAVNLAAYVALRYALGQEVRNGPA